MNFNVFIYFVVIIKVLLCNTETCSKKEYSKTLLLPKCGFIGGKFHAYCSRDAFSEAKREKCIPFYKERVVRSVRLGLYNSINNSNSFYLVLTHKILDNITHEFPEDTNLKEELLIEYGHVDDVSISVKLKNNIVQKWNGTVFECHVEWDFYQTEPIQRLTSTARLIVSGKNCSTKTQTLPHEPNYCRATINENEQLIPPKRVRFASKPQVIPRNSFSFMKILEVLHSKRKLSGTSNGIVSLSSEKSFDSAV